MSKLAGMLVVLVLAVVVGGGVFLAAWDVPAPSAKVEKVIPDERFAR
ncbi:MAG: hypothetical protein ACM33T_07410 [Solirubrobacterales bacterium]